MLALKSVSEWLERNSGKDILIRKLEGDDVDEIRLNLTGVGYINERSAADDYVSDNALLLYGKGFVITEGNEVELPANKYEIPLPGLTQAEVRKETAILETERAKYLLLMK